MIAAQNFIETFAKIRRITFCAHLQIPIGPKLIHFFLVKPKPQKQALSNLLFADELHPIISYLVKRICNEFHTWDRR